MLEYKQRLTDRFLELLADLKCIDREFALEIRTSDMELMGKHIAEAHKVLQNILDGSDHKRKFFEQKKSKLLESNKK